MIYYHKNEIVIRDLIEPDAEIIAQQEQAQGLLDKQPARYLRKMFDKTPTKYITNVATDGIVPRLREEIEAMPKKEYQAFVEWHFATCERLDQQGFSSHLLYICKKTGK